MVLFGSALFGLFTSMLVAFGLIALFYDQQPSDIVAAINLESEHHIAVLRIVQVANSIGLFFLPPLALAYIHRHRIGSLFRLERPPKAKVWLLVSLLFICILPSISFIGFLNGQIVFPESMRALYESLLAQEQETAALTMAFLGMESYSDFLLNIFMIALIPAVGEELLFRGSLQGLIESRFNNAHLAIWVTAFLFSAIHQQFFGFFPRLLLGALLGYLFYWSRNLWIPIIGHFVNNAFAVVLAFIYPNEMLDTNPKTFGEDWYEWVALVMSLAITTFLILILKGLQRKPEPATDTSISESKPSSEGES